MSTRASNCLHCQTELIQRQGRGRPRKYCSRSCEHKAYYLRHQEDIKTKSLQYYYAYHENNMAKARELFFSTIIPAQKKVDKMFTLLNEDEREDYAEWLLFIGSVDSLYARVNLSHTVDDWLADYAVSAG